MERTTLVLAFLAACATQRAEQRVLSPAEALMVKSCKGEREHGMVTLECGEDVVLHVGRNQTESADAPVMREETLRMLVAGLQQEGMAVEGARPHALGARASAVAFDVKVDDDAGPQRGRGIAAAVSESATMLVSILCFDLRDKDLESLCPPFVAHIAAHGVPPAVVEHVVISEVRFAGRALPVPPGCQSNTGEDLSCLATNLAWEHAAADAPAGAETAFVDDILKSVANVVPSAPRKSDLACAIEGVQTTCARYLWSAPDAGPPLMVVIAGAARVRGERVGLVCSFKVAESPDALPPVCATVLAIGQ